MGDDHDAHDGGDSNVHARARLDACVRLSAVVRHMRLLVPHHETNDGAWGEKKETSAQRQRAQHDKKGTGKQDWKKQEKQQTTADPVGVAQSTWAFIFRPFFEPVSRMGTGFRRSPRAEPAETDPT